MSSIFKQIDSIAFTLSIYFYISSRALFFKPVSYGINSYMVIPSKKSLFILYN